MKQTKLKKLEELFEARAISKEEYEKKKKEIEEMPEEKAEEEKEEEMEKEEKMPEKETKLKSDRMLMIGVGLIILLFIAIFSVKYFVQEKPETIDDLHALNLKGKLKPEQGYLYKDAYSFVKFDELWYAQLMSPEKTRFYNIQFRYSPRDLEDIRIYGSLDTKLFNNATDYYATFDPKGNDFAHVAVAIADFNQHMTSIFFKKPIAACDKNETFACKDRPIINCDNTDKVVLYVKEANTTKVYYDDNCIVVEGTGFEMVRGVDRVLFDFYKIMEE